MIHYSIERRTLLQLLEGFVLLDGPVFAVEEGRLLADEHFGSLLVALQLPVEPGQGGDGELAAVRLTVGTAMTYGIVDGAGRYVADEVEVVHTVLVGDVRRTAQYIYNRCMDVFQLRLLWHWHATDSL